MYSDPDLNYDNLNVIQLYYQYAEVKLTGLMVFVLAEWYWIFGWYR